jgi:hypothetical protein
MYVRVCNVGTVSDGDTNWQIYNEEDKIEDINVQFLQKYWENYYNLCLFCFVLLNFRWPVPLETRPSWHQPIAKSRRKSTNTLDLLFLCGKILLLTAINSTFLLQLFIILNITGSFFQFREKRASSIWIIKTLREFGRGALEKERAKMDDFHLLNLNAIIVFYHLASPVMVVRVTVLFKTLRY